MRNLENMSNQLSPEVRLEQGRAHTRKDALKGSAVVKEVNGTCVNEFISAGMLCDGDSVAERTTGELSEVASSDRPTPSL